MSKLNKNIKTILVENWESFIENYFIIIHHF